MVVVLPTLVVQGVSELCGPARQGSEPDPDHFERQIIFSHELFYDLVLLEDLREEEERRTDSEEGKGRPKEDGEFSSVDCRVAWGDNGEDYLADFSAVGFALVGWAGVGNCTHRATYTLGYPERVVVLAE